MLTVHFNSQGRLLEGRLYLPEKVEFSLPTLLFEGSMTGATTNVMEFLARELSRDGFACLLIDHSYYGEEEGAPQPWESPQKRGEDIKSALGFLSAHSAVDHNKIIGVGISVGAEFLAAICRETNIFRGLALVQGPFDDFQGATTNLKVPTLVVEDAHLEAAADEISRWALQVLKEPRSLDIESDRFDWTQADL